MSHHRQSRLTFGEIRKNLERLGNKNELTPEEIGLLEEYRSIDFGVQALIDKAAAVEAFDIVKGSHPEAILTELGISFEEVTGRVYDSRYSRESKGLSRDEEDYIKRMMKANKLFLKHWDEIRKKLKKKEEGAKNKERDELIAKLKSTLNNSERDSQIQQTRLVTTIVQAVIEDGWQLNSESETAINNLSIADYTQRGLSFLARNAHGDEVDVRVTGNGIYVHVEDTKNNLLACADKSNQLMLKIETLMRENFSKDLFGGIQITTESMGVGKGEAPSNLPTGDEDLQNPSGPENLKL